MKERENDDFLFSLSPLRVCVCVFSFPPEIEETRRKRKTSLSLSTLRTGERLSIEWFMVASGAFGIWWQVRLPRKDPSTQGPSSLIVMCARSFQFQEGKNRRCYIHSALYTHISLLAPTKSLSLSLFARHNGGGSGCCCAPFAYVVQGCLTRAQTSPELGAT